MFHTLAPMHALRPRPDCNGSQRTLTEVDFVMRPARPGGVRITGSHETLSPVFRQWQKGARPLDKGAYLGTRPRR
jgi:hypothetical protein